MSQLQRHSGSRQEALFRRGPELLGGTIHLGCCVRHLHPRHNGTLQPCAPRTKSVDVHCVVADTNQVPFIWLKSMIRDVACLLRFGCHKQAMEKLKLRPADCWFGIQGANLYLAAIMQQLQVLRPPDSEAVVPCGCEQCAAIPRHRDPLDLHSRDRAS